MTNSDTPPPHLGGTDRDSEAVRELEGGATTYTDERVEKTVRAVGGVVEGLRSLTDPEGNLSCIPEGPERHELEAALRDLEGAPLTDDLEHRLRTGREEQDDG